MRMKWLGREMIQLVHCHNFEDIILVVNVCRVILCIATINSNPLPAIINHFIILQMGWGESHQCNLQGKLMTNQQLIFSLLDNYFIKVIFYILRAKVSRVWHLWTKLSSTFAVTEGSSCQTRGCGHISRHQTQYPGMQSRAYWRNIPTFTMCSPPQRLWEAIKLSQFVIKMKYVLTPFKYQFSVNRILQIFPLFQSLIPEGGSWVTFWYSKTKIIVNA